MFDWWFAFGCLVCWVLHCGFGLVGDVVMVWFALLWIWFLLFVLLVFFWCVLVLFACVACWILFVGWVLFICLG